MKYTVALSALLPMKPLVIYHDNCPDGFTAAWAVWRSLGDEAEYRAMNYGQPMTPVEYGRRVIFVDFSLPRPEMETLISGGAQVEVYDHHKTAEAALNNLTDAVNVVFDMERSGAGIAWDEFHGAPRPRLIDYVEDRDLWWWALPDSREVSEYLFTLPRTFVEWDHMAAVLDSAVCGVAEIGSALLRAKRVRVATVCENARWMLFNIPTAVDPSGLASVPVVNTAWDFSEIGEYLCGKFPEAPCGGYYFDRADKRQWGFRSRGDFDVSVLCKRYGGGGHKAAAGFTSEIGWEPEKPEKEDGHGEVHGGSAQR